MESKKNTELFENETVSKAVWSLALPTIASMLVTVFYNLADTFFVGQTNDPSQVAAVSLVMPIFLIFMAFGNLFGIGGGAAISRFLGEKRTRDVKHVSSFCFYGAIATGIILGGISLIFMKQIVPLTGATTSTYDYIKEYLTYLAIGSPFIIVSNAFGNIVRSDGSAKAAMIGMMIGTITNIILDPVMIMGMKMGVVGAAIATVLGNVVATIYYIVLLWKSDSSLSLRIQDLKFHKSLIENIFFIGIPASLNNILMSVASIIYNVFLSRYGDAPVAAMGIAMKCNTLTVMLILGLTMGAQPLIGYCYGARNYDRMKKVIKYILLVAIIMGAVVSVLFLSSANPVVKAFINDAEVIAYGTKMLRIQVSTAPILGIMFVSMSSLQSMGKALPSLILSISRQGLVFIPAAYILNRIWKLDGLVWAQPLGDIVSVIIGLILLVVTIRGLKSEVDYCKA